MPSLSGGKCLKAGEALTEVTSGLMPPVRAEAYTVDVSDNPTCAILMSVVVQRVLSSGRAR